MPAEWAPHERTLMAWPARTGMWGGLIEHAKRDYAATARAIVRFEPVLMVCPPGAASDVRAHCGADVEALELPIDDSWLRDNGPIVLLGPDGERAGVKWGFNAWGAKFSPWDRDAELPVPLLEHLGIDRIDAPMILEGGSITVDGEGTLITTEQCLLNPNRNPSLSREEIEDNLREYVGVERVIWLGQGLPEDRDTDGHVDLVCEFTRPGQVIFQSIAGEDDPYRPIAEDNLRRLAEARDARGRPIEVLTLDTLHRVPGDDGPVAVTCLNFYVCNGGVVVPVPGTADDETSLARIAAAFPGREIVAVPGETIARGGGGPHCITQQVPAAR